MMTRKARALGMRNTTYRNANGLPNDEQITTARDQALLGIAIQERFPKYYRYFSLPSFVYRGSAMRNHNHLLGEVEGVDGIKTGYTRDSGFNLVTSVKRGPRHIVAVVLGGRSAGSRDARMRDLIDEHIAEASTKAAEPQVAERRAKAEPAAAVQDQVGYRRHAQRRSRSRASETDRGDRARLERADHAAQGEDRHGAGWCRRRTRRLPSPSVPSSRAEPSQAETVRGHGLRRGRSSRRAEPSAGCDARAACRRARQAAGHDRRRQGTPPRRPPRPTKRRLPPPATPPAAAGRSRSAPTRTKAKPSSI